MPRASWEEHEQHKEHAEEDLLERYVMGEAGAEEIEALEDHLLVCAACQDRVEELETWLRDFRGAVLETCACITVSHATDAGPVRLHAEARADGTWEAGFRGRELEGGDVFSNRTAAFEYLRRCFSEMFPRHVCGRMCRIEECRAAPDT